MKNQSLKDKNYREFRCPQCNALQFKYRLEKDAFKISCKCYGCNHFSTLELNLEFIAEVLNQLKEASKKRSRSKK